MKNVEQVFKRPSFSVRMQDAPPPRGWTLKYLSGAEERGEIKPGHLLIDWYVDSRGTVFNFGPEFDQVHVFATEMEAADVGKWIEQHTDVKSEVTKFG
jgi:hypothetical protein